MKAWLPRLTINIVRVPAPRTERPGESSDEAWGGLRDIHKDSSRLHVWTRAQSLTPTEWKAYANWFIERYRLDPDQAQRAILRQCQEPVCSRKPCGAVGQGPVRLRRGTHPTDRS